MTMYQQQDAPVTTTIDTPDGHTPFTALTHTATLMPPRNRPARAISRGVTKPKPAQTKSAADQLTDFTKRVRYLVDRYDGGNATAAARRIRTSQRGFAKVYSGDVTDPRLDFLVRLIDAYPQEDPLWILTGREERDQARFLNATKHQAVTMLKDMIKGIDPMALENRPGSDVVADIPTSRAKANHRS